MFQAFQRHKADDAMVNRFVSKFLWVYYEPS